MNERIIFLSRDISEFLIQLKAFIDNKEKIDSFWKGSLNQRENRKHSVDASDHKAKIIKWIAGGKLEKIAEKWRLGQPVDWTLFYGDVKPHRVSLPTYTFSKEHYWIPEACMSGGHTGNASMPLESGDSSLYALSTSPDIKSPARRVINLKKSRSSEYIQEHIESALKHILLLDENVELNTEATFFDLGLDSISIVNFIRQLSQQFDLSLRETLVFDYPTIRDLAGYIVRQNPEFVEPQANQAVISKEDTCQFKDHLAQVMKKYEEVFPLHTDGNGPILFCIPPMSGDVGIYSKLAEAAQNRFRMIGIKSRGFLTEKPPCATIEEMGQYNVEIMTAIDPEGPYHLFGSSMGGTVAYESARQIQLQNKHVKTLLLLESPLVENEVDSALWDSDEFHNMVMNANFLMIAMLHLDIEFRRKKARGEIEWPDLEITYDEVKNVVGEELTGKLVFLIRQRGVKQDEDLLAQRLESMAHIHLMNLRGLNSYRPVPLPRQENIRAILLRTQQARAISTEVYNPDYLVRVQQEKGSLAYFLSGWKRILSGLETEVINGKNHFDLLNTTTAAREVADFISASLNSQRDDSIPLKNEPKMHHPSYSAPGMGFLQEPRIKTQIAVIGMAGQFPGGRTLDDFWLLLKRGKTAFTEFPKDRGWEIDKIYDKIPQANKTYVRYGGFVKNIDRFDPVFFHIPPKEAEMTDPSERLFLQESWKAIEDAGIDPAGLSGKPWGVFCGGGGDYSLMLKELTGMSPHVTLSSIPGRVSYSLNLTGPAVFLDAGCASSGLAIAQACDHLILNKCEAAIAGGVFIHTTPNLIIASCQARLLSQYECCHALGEGANGMMPAEAVGVLVLKPFARAVEDGDRIYGVIEAWGNNHSGKTNGMASPGAETQSALFSEVWRKFKINPETIGMVEANATGTPLGDSIEVQALTSAFRETTRKRQFCSLGSVENNIGHAFQCSGMSHIMKVLLALHHKEIPATVNIEKSRADVTADSPFFINTQVCPWKPQAGQIRRAAVSSFGGTGTNVHLVIAEPPAEASRKPPHLSESGPALICLSAKTKTALNQRYQDLKKFLESQNDIEKLNLAQLSANLLKRSHFSVRCAFAVAGHEQLLDRLSKLIDGITPEDVFTGTAREKTDPSLSALARTTVNAVSKDKKAGKTALSVLADLYVKEISFDLLERFSEAEKFTLSLPAYPFEKKRCWMTTPLELMHDRQENIRVPEVSDIHRDKNESSGITSNHGKMHGKYINQFAPGKLTQDKTGSPSISMIHELVTEITGYQSGEIDIKAPLNRFGLDSLMSMRLLAIINERFALELQLADLVEHNSIWRLASLVNIEISLNRGAREPAETGRFENVFCEDAAWFSNRLGVFPDDLHFISLDGKSAGAMESSPELYKPELCKPELEKLIQKGIGIIHDGLSCYFISCKSIDIQAGLESLSPQEKGNIIKYFPVGTLIAPVSQEQERNLYHSEIMKQSAWNVQHVYELAARSITTHVLNQAMARLVEKHDLLRTCYVPLERGWAQIVAPDTVLKIQDVEMSSLADFQKFLGNETARLLNIEKTPIFQVWISQIDQTWYLGFVTHHSLSDAFTLTLLFSELMSSYHALLNHEEPALQPITEQYWQYAIRQFGERLNRTGAARRYWMEQLAHRPLPMQLPYTRDPHQVENKLLLEADWNTISLSPTLCEAIKRFTREYEITHTQLFTTAITLMLIHGMGNHGAVIHFINSRRDRNSLINTLGEFTNVLFLPLDIDNDGSIIQALRIVRKKILDGLRYAKTDFIELLKLTELNSYENYYRQSGDVMVNSADIDAGTLEASTQYGRSLFTESFQECKEAASGALAVATLFYQILKMNQRIHLITSFRKHLFDASEMRQLSKFIIQIVEKMVHNPEERVDEMLLEMNATVESLQNRANGDKHPLYPGISKQKNLDTASTVPEWPAFFTECQRVNRIKQGRPVFWVHGAFGDASVYIPLAEKCRRPFYGIQARGLFDDKAPLSGVKTIAEFYLDMIRSIQPVGPYDLGGYSVGGSFAFEIARLIQAAGQTVQSLTLADALFPPVHERLQGDRYDLLYFVSMGLIDMTFRKNPEKSVDALDILEKPQRRATDEISLLESFVQFCMKAGVNKPEEWVRNYIKKMADIQDSYKITEYAPQPLTCEIPYVRYFKNRNGLLYGKNAVHFNSGGADPLKDVDYWSDWKNLLPDIVYQEIIADNHLMLFEDQPALQVMRDYCHSIYHRKTDENSPFTASGIRNSAHAASDRNALEEKAAYYFIKLFASVLKQPVDHIQDKAPLETYGIDSLMATQLVNQMQNIFGSLSVTLLFEYQTIRELTRYFIESHGPKLKKILGVNETNEAVKRNDREPVISEPAAVNNGKTVQNRIGRESLVNPMSTALDIAIIGISGCYPMASDLEEFWRNLCDGKDCIIEVPEDRWDWREYYTEDRNQPGAHYSKWGGFIDDVDKFDPLFFNISPREAELMDPQERLFLEHAWMALEDAGYCRENLKGETGESRVGVYAGVMYGEYQFLGVEAGFHGNGVALGRGFASIANRVSYILNLNGPSMTVDTACSSSLTSLHLACRDLKYGSTDMGIAGGVNVSIHPNKYLGLSMDQFLSTRGRCVSFGEGGDGFIPGEGVGVVLLKRLTDAEQDGDHIYGVIKGSAVNHGGRTNGYTVPNPRAQQMAISQALQESGINPRTISYIEAHGTGTKLGDPIEIAGLKNAFEKTTRERQFCWIGSVKSNIGHCESAAGVAGITKVLLQMRHGRIAPSLHSRVLNPHINFENTSFKVCQTLREWRRPVIDGKTLPRIAGISSFGGGGSNAHILIEEYAGNGNRKSEIRSSQAAIRNPCIFILSAKNANRLQEMVKNLHHFIENSPKLCLSDLAYTLQVGREAMPERMGFVADNVRKLRKNLEGFLEDQDGLEDIYTGRVKNQKPHIAMFAEDEDIVKAMNAWIDKRKYSKLLELWVNGGVVNWKRLYGNTKPSRISLPAYPFARERYWVETENRKPKSEKPKSEIRNPKNENHESQAETIMFAPVWNSITPLEKHAISPLETAHTVIVGGTSAQHSAIQNVYPNARIMEIEFEDTIRALAERLKTPGPPDHTIWIAPDYCAASPTREGIISEQDQGIIQIFRIVKALLFLGYGTGELSLTLITTQAQTVYKTDSADPTHAGIHGLAGSLAKEYSRWKIRLLDLETGCEWPVSEMFALPVNARGDSIAYRGKEWLEQELIPVREFQVNTSLFRSNGVYVVIGGAGGLGEVWSNYMVEKYHARLIWIGRREQDAEIRGKLDSLSKLGHAPLYIAADAGNQEALQNAYEEIKRTYPQIHGVIHSAIGIFDQSLADMDEKYFRIILSAKIDVSVCMARVFQNEPLDFVLFFSSIASFGKIGGMGGYSAGCVFKDAFANRLSKAWSCDVKVINWGYWRVGTGNTIPESSKIRMKQSGLRPIEPEEGMEALEKLLAGPFNQLVFLKTLDPRPLEMINNEEWIAHGPETIPPCLEKFRKISPIHENEVERMKTSGAFLNDEMEAVLLNLLRSIFQSLGLLGEEHLKITDSFTETNRPGFYKLWINESYRILEKSDNLRTSPASLEAAWKAWDRGKVKWEQNPNRKPVIVLAEACLRALPDILAGNQKATDIIFPDSSMELVEGIYKGNIVRDYFNEVLGDAMVAAIRERLERDPAARIRILEIGAGTGGTTAGILSKLSPYRNQIAEYCYTDISKAFLFHAKEQYAPEYPYITTCIFDVEKPIAGQDIKEGHYDMVVASNVLHATRNIRVTLRNTKAVLRRHGLVFLNEMSAKSLFIHLTFGLLEGWWLSEDVPLRIPGCPGLYPEVWRSVLEEEGFNAAAFPAETAHGLGQQIIVAESDGIIRQQESVQSGIALENENTVQKPKPSFHKSPSQKVEYGVTQEVLREKSIRYFKNLMGQTLRMESNRIDASEPLENYGIDSILIVQATGKLREVFDDISSTLFFEVRTINALVDHFIKTQKDALIELLGLESPHSQEKNHSLDEIEIDHIQSPVASETRINTAEQVLPSITSQIKGESKSDENSIAIIGMSGRYPQADTLESYWEVLKTGRDCITEIPSNRWPLEGFFHPDSREAVELGKSYCKWGGFLTNVTEFDPLFFNISPKEAIIMDPHERLFLQSTWEALEDAGYTKDTLVREYGRNVGVFSGITKTGFDLYGPELWKHGKSMFPHTSFSSVANRVSYIFDLGGPSMPVDTMCSSSLTAIHEACEHLRRGECELAIAGGVNIYLHPSNFISLCTTGMLSAGGQCKSFGKDADGFVPGEGIGVILLKPLNRAVQDSDHIYAIIRATSVNHGGKTNGYAVPNPIAQEVLIRKTLDKADIHARTVSCIEAHGTGTVLGDPIEVTGLTRAFQKDTRDTGFCALGSAKANLGHLEAASGIAGLTKVVLQMKYGQLVPSLHAGQLNPNIEFDKTPFRVQQKLEKWKRPVIEIDGEMKEYPRIAGVSSFGAGGSNAHIVIEEYIEKTESRNRVLGMNYIESASRSPYIVVLSAKNEKQLKAYAGKLSDFIRRDIPDAMNSTEIAAINQVSGKAVEKKIRRLLSEVLHVNETEIEAEEIFSDYGVEPIHKSRLLEKITEELNVKINSTEFQTQNSISSIARSICKHDLTGSGIDDPALQSEKLKSVSSQINLADLAYTLQVGREHMEERLGLIVESVRELIEKLGGFLEGREDMEDLYRGQVRKNKAAMSVFTSDEDMAVTVDAWISKRKYSKLLSLWVKGLSVGWNKLYKEAKPRRISLPTYPFARESYWMNLNPEAGSLYSNINCQVQGKYFCSSPSAQEQRPASAKTAATLMFRPVWKEDAVAVQTKSPGYTRHIVLLCELASISSGEIEAQAQGVSCVRLQSEKKALAQRYQDISVQAFAFIRKILNQNTGGNILVQVLISSRGEGQVFSGLSGLLKTAHLENPGFTGQVIEIDPQETVEKLSGILMENRCCPWDDRVSYRNHRRLTVAWEEVPANGEPYLVPWKDDGIYLITGGAGGLGLLFAKEIAEKTNNATLILAGRSRLNHKRQKQIMNLESLGIRVQYRQLDVCELNAVDELIRDIGDQVGPINGILHSAGVIRDSFIITKSEKDFKAVLSPKVIGTVNLDKAAHDLDLDFFVLFSSGAGAWGNPGQADYSTANAFMDAYAVFRNERVAMQASRGKTLSINWPLWKEGGMRIDAETVKTMRRNTGMIAMETSSGMRALYRGLAGSQVRIMVMEGEPQRIRQFFSGHKCSTQRPPKTLISEAGQTDLLKKTLQQIKCLLGEIISLEADRIDAGEPLETYGIDSVMVTQLNRKLSAVFGEIPKTLFYQYETLDDLADYFITKHTQECIGWIGQGEPESFQSEIQPAHPSLTSEKKRIHTFAPAEPNNRTEEPIAIIGLAGHYPMADTLDAFWENLKAGRDCITGIPYERWSFDEYYKKLYGNTARGGILDSFSDFDPLFFNITPVDALDMDPHERLILTTCWEAMENSGYSRESLRKRYNGSVGVFVGITKLGFYLHTRLGPTPDTSRLPFTSFSSMANRVSYHLNLNGPSMAIDTMCSSSITAIHEACEHIRRGDCQLAFAGAVNLYLHPRNYLDLHLGKMMTDEPEIHCFSKSGKGFIPGEGVGAVLLKPLEQAVDDGDHIEGIILGTGINHGGKTNGYTVPSLNRQRELIHAVLQRAGCDADAIDYIESSANGSAMGDAIEFDALSQAFRKRTGPPCCLGSLKPNIGHLEAASGMSQLTKVLFQMKHHVLAPTRIRPEYLDETLQWEKSPFQLMMEVQNWPSSEASAHNALITSFGAGGSYAAMVVGEYKNTSSESVLELKNGARHLILLSARTEPQLQQYAKRLLAHLEKTEVPLPSLAYTLWHGRDAMRFRMAVTVRDQKELLACLDAYLRKQSKNTLRLGDAKRFNTMKEYTAIEEIQDRVVTALGNQDLKTLSDLWLKGYDKIAWEELYDKPVPLCSLPTYPFESRSFWYEQKKTAPVATPDHLMPEELSATELQNESQPTAELRIHLMSVIRDILLLNETDELDEDTTFFDLGLDSINVVRFVRKLSQTLSLSLRETLIFDYPTIGSLARYIAQQERLMTQAKPDKKVDAKDKSSLFRNHLGSLIKTYKEAVPLQIKGDGPLLFCIHPMSGDVGLYTKLAEAANHRFRVIGIRSKGFLTGEAPLSTILEMGGHNTKMMIEIAPEGPYHIFGASMGGTVAYETARQLQQQNKKVATLLLLEAPLVENEEDGVLWDSDHIHNWLMNANFLMITMLHIDHEFRRKKADGKVFWPDMEITYDEVKYIDEDKISAHLAALITRRGVKQTETVLVQRLESMARIHLANLRGLSRYRPIPLLRPEESKAVLFRTRTAHAVSKEVYNPDYLKRVQQQKGSMEPFLEGWKTVLPRLETLMIHGENHFDLLNTQSAVRDMADIIAEVMGVALKDNSNGPVPVEEKPAIQPGVPYIDKTRKTSHAPGAGNKIAVIGMSGQFPGSDTIEGFWRLLKNGRSAITDFPDNRGWDIEKIYDKVRAPDKTYVRHGGFLENINRFDPLFFRIPPKEAEMMEPSERLFLQESWKAIEDAGIDPAALSGKPWGVFCGGGGDYTLRLRDITGISPHVTVSGIPGRVSYSLNLTGPCLSLDAGCASSLLALAQACDYLASGKCEAAVAGGVLTYTTPNLIITGCRAALFSEDEICRAFDAQANGMMPGEAVGVLILKPLDKAIFDCDRIHGVIEAWGSNHNGKTNGMAAPSGASQADLFSEVYHRFNIHPESVTMVEANAVGTPLGDKIEVQALGKAFRRMTEKKQYCALGTVENNIGHSFQSSGISHVIKTLLALRHDEIPATLNVKTPHPSLELDDSPFFINTQNFKWKTGNQGVRRAAVSSFGATGMNVHLVISDAPQPAPQATGCVPTSDRPVLIALSAKTKTALGQRCLELKEFMEDRQEEELQNLARVSANLLIRRSHFSERCALVVSNIIELRDSLSNIIAGKEIENGITGSVHRKVNPSLSALAKTVSARENAGKEALLALAELYVQGVVPDVSDYFTKAEKLPMSLPGYPFEKRRCWIAEQDRLNPARENDLITLETSQKSTSSLLTIILELVMEITGYEINELAIDAPLNQFGLDSLMSMRLLALIDERFSIKLYLADLSEHNSIERLAALVEKEMPEISERSEEVGITPFGDIFTGQSNWLSERLSSMPNDLCVVRMERESAPVRESSVARYKQILAELTGKGIAVFNDGAHCYFISHRSADINTIINSVSREKRKVLLAQLPVETLIAPVSREQERNLYQTEVINQSSGNIQHIYELRTDTLDISILNQSLACLIAHYDLLRTCYLDLKNCWAQVIAPGAGLEFQVTDMPTLSDFQNLIATERNRLLNVEKLPIFQVRVSHIKDKYYLGFVTHHSLADAFTTTMLFSELMNCYSVLLQGQTPPSQPVTEQYWQYSLGQFENVRFRKSESVRYWQEQLSGTALSMKLPYKYNPQKVAKERSQAADGNLISLSASLCEEIKHFNHEYEITYTQLFTTAITILLIHGMGNTRGVIQFVNNQRDRVSLLNTPGEFTNVLFVPLDMEPEWSVIHALKDVKMKTLESLRHAKTDFSQLLELAGLDNYDNYFGQLGDVMVDSANIDALTSDTFEECGRSLFIDSLVRQKQSILEGQAVATLFYQILKVNQRIHLITSYRKHLFVKSEMHRLSALIIQIVEEMVHHPERQIKELLYRMNNSVARLEKRVKRYGNSMPSRIIEPEERDKFSAVRIRPGKSNSYNLYKDERIIEALGKLRSGILSINEVEHLIKQGTAS